MKERTAFQKILPNLITLFRLVVSPALLLFEPFSNRFLLLYVLLGTSDILDGFLARRWGVSGKLGARLDSAADFLFCGILLYLIFNNLCWPVWALIWIGAILLIRLSSLTISYVRFNQFSFLHTWTNKATGLPLLLFPLFLRLVGQDWTMNILCSAASISAVEEFLISLISNEFDPNRKSIFSKKPPSHADRG